MRKFTTFILLFLVLCLSFTEINAQNADIDWLTRINSPTPTALRDYSAFVSKYTELTAVALPVTIGIVSLIKQDDQLLKDALYIGVSLGLATALTYGLKYSINRTRPYDAYPALIDASYRETSPSFPSGNTSISFAMATSLILTYPKWYVAVPGFLWAGSVGYSRMNLGVHYPSDVLAGALLGAGSAYFTHCVNKWFWQKHDNKKLIGLQVYQ